MHPGDLQKVEVEVEVEAARVIVRLKVIRLDFCHYSKSHLLLR